MLVYWDFRYVFEKAFFWPSHDKLRGVETAQLKVLEAVNNTYHTIHKVLYMKINSIACLMCLFLVSHKLVKVISI